MSVAYGAMRKVLLVVLLLMLAGVCQAQTYSTSFPNTQNPISEGGQWINGGTTGLDWGNVQSTPGKGFGVSLPSQFGDPTAILTGTWNSTQQAQGTVFLSGSFAGPGHEVEIRLRTNISAHNINGYEILCSVVAGDPYMQVVRWNGALASFVVLDQNSNGCANGDVFKATITGAASNTQIQVFKNGTLQTFTNCGCTTVVDTAGIANGSPGIGFYDNQDGLWANFGFSAFSATAGGGGGGGTVTALSCSQLDVQTAINNATAGQTVNIPAGNCTWGGANAVQINGKAITLNGASNTTTIINLPRDVSTVFHVTKSTSGVTRIQNINFKVNLTGTVKATPHPVVFDGPWPNGQPIVFTNNVINLNVADFSTIATPGGVIAANNVVHGTVVGDTFFALKQPNDNTSWNTANSFGTRDTTGWMNTYIETNTLDGGANATDCDDECRVVYRFNIGQTGGTFNSHGADTSPQGMRQFEIYGNNLTITFPAPGSCGGNTAPSNINQWIWIRGGTGFIYNNAVQPLFSQCWGQKAMTKLAIRNIEDNFRPTGTTCATITYPSYHQLGQDFNGTSFFTNPIQFWGNTAIGSATTNGFHLQVTAGFMFVFNPDGTIADPCGFDWNTFDRWGRDQINTTVGSPTLPFLGGSVEGLGGTPAAGYTPYPYPHPLVSGGPTVPQPPSNLQVAASGTNANLTWTASPTAGITGYHVYRSTVHGGPYSLTASPTVTNFTDTPGTGTFFWVVTAFNSSGESARTNEVTAQLPVTVSVSFAPTSLTFAARTVGSPSPSQTVTVTNTSSAGSTVTFSLINFTGTNPSDFSRTTTCTTLTTTGQQCTVQVTFTPGAPGARSALLTFTDNATGSPQTIPVSGSGIAQTPIANLSPASHDFGSQMVLTTSTSFALTLTNSGTGTLSVTSITPTGDFAVSSTVPASTCGTNIAPGGQCLINVTFTPTVSGGRVGSLSIVDNASGSPHVATLSGTGIVAKCQMDNTVTLSGGATLCGP